MDSEKLIEQLRWWADNCDRTNYGCQARPFLLDAATALSTLQAENAQLRESRDHWKRLAHELSEGVNGKDAGHERLQIENEKLRTELDDLRIQWDMYGGDVGITAVYKELEQVKRERDAAQALLAETSGVIGSAPITTAFGVPLDRLRELVEADRTRAEAEDALRREQDG